MQRFRHGGRPPRRSAVDKSAMFPLIFSVVHVVAFALVSLEPASASNCMSWEEFRTFIRVRCKERPGSAGREAAGADDGLPWARFEEIFQEVVAQVDLASTQGIQALPHHEISNTPHQENPGWIPPFWGVRAEMAPSPFLGIVVDARTFWRNRLGHGRGGRSQRAVLPDHSPFWKRRRRTTINQVYFETKEEVMVYLVVKCGCDRACVSAREILEALCGFLMQET